MLTTNRSKLTDNIIVCCLFLVLFAVCMIRHGNGRDVKYVISSDPSGYYAYLPAVFIDKGIHHIDHEFTG